MAYDSRCYDLAEVFLGDEPLLNTEAHRAKLAQEIQDCIESYIQYERSNAEPTEQGLIPIPDGYAEQ